MDQQEIQDTADAVRRFILGFGDLISATALGHLNASVIVLDSIRPLAPQSELAPSRRVGGLCPCELADAAKKLV